jgi:hypothetical protein
MAWPRGQDANLNIVFVRRSRPGHLMIYPRIKVAGFCAPVALIYGAGERGERSVPRCSCRALIVLVTHGVGRVRGPVFGVVPAYGFVGTAEKEMKLESETDTAVGVLGSDLPLSRAQG